MRKGVNMGGFVKRMPSKAETKFAEEKGKNAYWSAIGRYWESNGKTFISIAMIPDAVFMLSEDKPKEGAVQTKQSSHEEIY